MRFILLVVLIDMLSVGIIVPVLPSIVGRLTANPVQQTAWYGALVLSFAVTSFFGGPILGALSDAFGRRPILLLGFCGLAINFFATGLATSLAVLVASRAVGGGMQANAAVANAYVADITAPEDRAKRFGQVGAMFGIGFIAGPVIGGLLGGVSLSLPFFVSGALALANLAYGVFVLPESLPHAQRRPFALSRANPFSALKGLGAIDGGWRLVGVFGAAYLAQMVLYTTWVLFTGFRFGWGPFENGWSLCAIGVVSAVTQGVLLKPLLARFEADRLALAGLFASVLSYCAFGFATAGWMMFVIPVLGFLGNTVGAVMQGVISRGTDPARQGQTMGALSALSSLAAVVAPLTAAPLLATVSHLPPRDWRVGAPMFFCAALQAIALAFAVAYFRPGRRSGASHARCIPPS